MKEFMLLMKGDDSSTASPEEMQSRMEAYRGWMKRQMDDGVIRQGQPLEPTGIWLKDRDTVLTDGPFLEQNEVIGGYVIVRATDLEQATAIARDCPLLEHCEIMVRPLIEVPT